MNRSRAFRLLVPLLIVIAALVSLLKFVGAFTPAVREAPLSLDGEVYEVNRDAGGRLWISDNRADEVWQVDPPSGVYTVYHGLYGATDARTDASGLLWLSDIDNNRLGRYVPGAATATTWLLDGNGSPIGVAFDPAGNVWVGDFSQPLVYRFDPLTADLCAYTIPQGALAGATEYVLARDGFVWFGDWRNGRIIRLNPALELFTYWEIHVDTFPEGMVFDDLGKLWWADSGRNMVSVLDASAGQLTNYSVPVSATRQNRDRVNDRYDRLFSKEALLPPYEPWPNMVAYQDGFIWFTDFFNGRVGRLDPLTAHGNTANPKPVDVPASQTCRNAGPGNQIPITIDGGMIDWNLGAYTRLVDGQGWIVDQLPAETYPWGIVATTDHIWLAEQKLVNHVLDQQFLGWFAGDDCILLASTHSGSGADPVAQPGKTAGCYFSTYEPGQVVNLTADPALGWKVESWSGTDNDQTESLQNTATMPSADHLVEVHYVPLAHKSFLPIVIK